MRAVRDRRRPVELHPCLPADPAFVYYRDRDGAIRPKQPALPDPNDAASVLSFFLEVDRLSRGKNGAPYNPRLVLTGEFRALAERAVAAAKEQGRTIWTPPN